MVVEVTVDGGFIERHEDVCGFRVENEALYIYKLVDVVAIYARDNWGKCIKIEEAIDTDITA